MSTSPDLHGKVAVVTGASRGLGKMIALALARHGASVALVARSAEALREVEQEITGQGCVARSIAADLMQPHSADEVKRQVTLGFGPAHILVNTAGMFGPIALVQDSDPRAWIATQTLNVIAPYLLCRAFLPGMIESGWGRIVNVSSAASLHTPGPLNSAYAVSKVALNRLTRAIAVEIEGSGVTANAIHPGDVKTEMWADIRDQCMQLPYESGYLEWVWWVDETGGDPPEKAADLVLRLCSDEAAAINGQFLWIEDGLQTPIASW
jgi:NAD(P)-dependent dehydrogenase (short-subunit alcohol dehydrogenase family)